MREVAIAHGENAMALLAARAAFEANAALVDYQAVRPLAGDGWPAIKAELLAHLAARDSAYERTDIYLAEGIVDAAIQAIDAQPYVGHDEQESTLCIIERVASAAWQSHPDGVIRQCRRQAEPIMDGAKSKYYSSAIHWLHIAGRAYRAAGRADEWRTYCEGLITKHARKYRLAPQLRELLAGR